ncbi:MAG: hypothetical protein H7844_07535 [Nitrospirae bacterium YQR-1]
MESGEDVESIFPKNTSIELEKLAKEDTQKAAYMVDSIYKKFEQLFANKELKPRGGNSSQTFGSSQQQPGIQSQAMQYNSSQVSLSESEILTIRQDVKSEPTNSTNLDKRVNLLEQWAKQLRNQNENAKKIYTNESTMVLRGLSKEAPSKAMPIVDSLFADLEALLNNTFKPKTKPVVKKTVPFDILINAKRVRVSEGVPSSETGASFKSYPTDFKTYEIDVRDGKLRVDLGQIPLYIEPIEQADMRCKATKDSPFVMISPEVEALTDLKAPQYAAVYAADLGFKWIRFIGATGINFSIYRYGGPGFSSGSAYLDQLKFLYDDAMAKGLFVIPTIHPVSEGSPSGKRIFDSETEKQYKDFVKAVLNKFPHIKYYFVETEADHKMSPVDYAISLAATSKVMREQCSDCKIITAGYVSPELPFYKEVFEQLNKMNIKNALDAFDFWHAFSYINVYNGNYTEYEMMKRQYADSLNLLSQNGYKDTQIWLGETSFPSDTHNPYATGYSEQKQASDVIARHTILISLGVKKINWNYIIDPYKDGGDYSYFDYVGFIHNTKNKGLSGRKLSYYTYKLMIEKFSCFENAVATKLPVTGGVDGYRFDKNGKTLIVVWQDIQ